jgi:sugar phosphate isomerase/epimerase
MNPWPIGLSTGCFSHRNLFDVLEPIHTAGFRELEICSLPKHLDYHLTEEVRRAGGRLQSLGLRPFSFHAPFAERIDITSLEEPARLAAVDELTKACESAALLGCQNVVLHPGPERAGRPPEAEFLQRMHRAAESLNQVAARCSELGLQILLENMLAHLLFGPVRDMLYLLGEINTCNVGTCLDTGHAHLAGEMSTVIQKLSGHLKLVHVNDNFGDWDAHLPPGQGRIDWPQFVAELKRSEFHGVLVLEMAGYAHESVDAILTRAIQAREFLGRLCENAARTDAA